MRVDDYMLEYRNLLNDCEKGIDYDRKSNTVKISDHRSRRYQLDPAASTSMQRDLRQGRESELDGLVFEVVRMGKTLGVSVPNYERIAQNFC